MHFRLVAAAFAGIGKLYRKLDPVMELVSTDDNPLPPNGQTGTIAASGGARLRYATWRALKPPCKGTIVLLHGRAEFIEKYFETITNLRESGFDVCTFDWRGQGGSSRLIGDPAKGYIESFHQYVDDLDAILNGVALPDCRPPYFILAHSTGSLVAMLAAPRIASRVQRMVLCCPLLRFGETPMPQGLLVGTAGLLATFGLGTAYMGGGRRMHSRRVFAGNRLTSDMQRFQRNTALAIAHPELAIGGPTVAWIHAAGVAMQQVTDPDFIGSIAIPTLLVAAGSDRVVSLPAIEDMGFKMRSGRTVAISGARHELMQERDVFREQMFAALLAFVPGTPAMPKVAG
jgi:lysophospholipase